jgi:hypothetical protein
MFRLQAVLACGGFAGKMRAFAASLHRLYHFGKRAKDLPRRAIAASSVFALA